MQNYGEALKYQREIAHLTQPELAQKIGTSQQNISRWERNEVLPNIDFCVQLASFYGISIDDLLCLSGSLGARTSAPAPSAAMRDELTADDKKLLDVYHTLDEDMKATLWALLGTWTPTTTLGVGKKQGTK